MRSREVFSLSSFGLGAAVASALQCTSLGALVAGRPGDRYGGRGMLRVVDAVCDPGAVAWNLSSFAVFRFFAGIAIGGCSVPAPVYLATIAPAHRRGALVGLFQAFPVIAAHANGAPFALLAGMMLLQFIAAFFFMPETRGVALEHMSDLLRAPRRVAARRNM
jgi:MFS family permease